MFLRRRRGRKLCLSSSVPVCTGAAGPVADCTGGIRRRLPLPLRLLEPVGASCPHDSQAGLFPRLFREPGAFGRIPSPDRVQLLGRRGAAACGGTEPGFAPPGGALCLTEGSQPGSVRLSLVNQTGIPQTGTCIVAAYHNDLCLGIKCINVDLDIAGGLGLELDFSDLDDVSEYRALLLDDGFAPLRLPAQYPG